MKPVDDFDSGVLREFIEQVLEGKLKPVRKSQLAPKKQSGAARIVVGSTFEVEVLKEKKDVFILFYAPDCGHCKNFMGDFKKIAKKYNGEEAAARTMINIQPIILVMKGGTIRFSHPVIIRLNW